MSTKRSNVTATSAPRATTCSTTSAVVRMFSVTPLVLAAILAYAPTTFAQEPSATVDTAPAYTKSVDFKVVKWALPTLGDNDVLDVLADIEYESYRYGVNYEFAVAVVAAEASFTNRIAVGRKRNVDIARLMTKSGGRAPYPSVTDDLANALSTLDDMLRTEESTEVALREYWADSARDYNTDTVAEFIRRVGEKYALMEGFSEQEAQENYLREIQQFPSKGAEDIPFNVNEMPNLTKQLVRYDVEPQYSDVARYFNPNLTDDEASKIARSVLTFSMQTDTVDPRLVMALIAAESRFRPRAVSKKGAMGLAQLMPATVKSHGIRDAFDPIQNVYVCVKYLEREIDRWGGRSNWLDLVLASYNAGSGAVRKYGGVPPYSETKSFVHITKKYYNELRGNR